MTARKKNPDGTPNPSAKTSQKASGGEIRYAVVGLGYFAQNAVLPAFSHASSNSRLAALVSDDGEKLRELGEKYEVENLYDYSGYQQLLKSGEIDAVYIVLPNDMHREYAVEAAKAGIHVLCEKPMAVTERDCAEMIRAANEHHAKLMVAYRLHMAEANLRAIEEVKSGRIGEPRFINSAFSMQVREGNIRVQPEHGGGPVFDLGVYCINAARYLFQAEPYEVVACTSSLAGDPRFERVEEMASAILRFPGDRQATFTCSFGAADTSWYNVVGTQGSLCLDQAYDYSVPASMEITVDGKAKTKSFGKKDQVAGEILYFSECILNDEEPEPSGLEGLADVRIINAVLELARTGRPVKIEQVEKPSRPNQDMQKSRPSASEPELLHVEPPTRD